MCGESGMDLVADGDYGDGSETASVSAEGLFLGSVGSTGFDCTQASGTFSLSAAQLATLIADGVVNLDVQNSPNVDAF